MRHELKYEVIYSPRRKTVGITVERDGRLVVRAPSGVDDEALSRAIASRERWIAEKLSHPQKYPPTPAPRKELVSGESMLFQGHEYRVELVDTNTKDIRFEGAFLVPRSLGEDARAAFRSWYQAAASEHLLPRLEDWATRLGVRPSRTRITDDRFRWGSCSSSGSIGINWRLIKAPTSVSDYVLAHELAHLLESAHGARFWSIVRAHVASAESSRRWLREYGHILEQEI
ncbi:M48 family metallopeptidase [Blastococcus sp. SYSU DS1021]